MRLTAMQARPATTRPLSEWTAMDIDYRVEPVAVRARDWSAALDVAAELMGVPRERLVLVPRYAE